MIKLAMLARSRNGFRWWGQLISAAILVGACTMNSAGPRAGKHPGPAPRDTRIIHEDCALDGSAAVKEDLNGDGRPDRTTSIENGNPVCQALDFNFDGVIDAWVYFDAAGKVRRRESDYDRDGRVDEIALYRDGQLIERQRATALTGKLDTWQHYRNGKLTSAERDSNGDDYVDQWWEYPDERTSDCPLIHSDVNGDGQPDPGATVDVCRERYAPTARDGAPPAARGLDQPGPGDLPTQVESDSAEPGTSSPAESDPAAGAGKATP
jgi:hypothetical protein